MQFWYLTSNFLLAERPKRFIIKWFYKTKPFKFQYWAECTVTSDKLTMTKDRSIFGLGYMGCALIKLWPLTSKSRVPFVWNDGHAAADQHESTSWSAHDVYHATRGDAQDAQDAPQNGHAQFGDDDGKAKWLCPVTAQIAVFDSEVRTFKPPLVHNEFLADDKMANISLDVHTFIAQKSRLQSSLDYTFLSSTEQ